MLYLSFTDFESTTTKVAFAVCIVLMVALVSCLVFCLSLGYRNGPYIKNSFQRGTLWKSYWGVRPINTEEPIFRRLASIRNGKLNNYDTDLLSSPERPVSPIKKNVICPSPNPIDQYSSVLDDRDLSIRSGSQHAQSFSKPA